MHHFSTGNIDTLNRSDIRSQLVHFYQTHYSANRMKLVILGKDSLSRLQSDAYRFFKSIPNRRIPQHIFRESPYPNSSYIPRMLYVAPVMDSHIINFYWPVPSLANVAHHDPAGYINYMLEHAGRGGLVWWMRRQGWLQYVNATLTIDSPSIAIFQYQLTLSPDTFNDRNTVTQIIRAVFVYIHMIRSESSLDMSRRWTNMRDEMNISWTYSLADSPYEYVAELSKRLHHLHTMPTAVLEPPSRLHFNRTLFVDIAQRLRPDNTLLHISSSSVPTHVYDKHERYYGVPYTDRTTDTRADCFIQSIKYGRVCSSTVRVARDKQITANNIRSCHTRCALCNPSVSHECRRRSADILATRH